ncbi:RNA polymerase sigma factor [Marinitenerispora sediminis]|uniref:Sigma-70 family RNA polymerase sigma factor n=1 Tax=Marinitenerispora sediminis TaxID=1931232 RepID=A0A368T292_9ACTN|nr:sigma-70 family RNA polymerase sigma factor [Marinitenerispora sediminis]RCV49212.1 hypothetical protein DEF28_21505 [Marinitenerispora sediminis]RCV51545.1 hypothetical protein DEF23_20265 [Marinitenerispora sediminis]RCV55126.1 hypothetical protein DEF24_18445 [Marinitenerispora sediminis]
MTSDPATATITPDHLRTAARLAAALHLGEGGSKQDAEDAVSYALLELWKRERSAPGEIHNPRAWMATAARRHLLRTFERAKVEAAHERLPDRPARVGRPEAEYEHSEAARRAMALVARLPRGERSAVALRSIDGMDTREIAEVLGISEDAVRARLSRGYRTLRRLLTEGDRTR